MLSFDDFKKSEIKIGEIKSAERVPETDKLLRLVVDVGEETPRQIISGIAEYVEPEILVGKKFPFVINLPSRVIRGFESNGMLLTIRTKEGGFSFLEPTSDTSPGSSIG